MARRYASETVVGVELPLQLRVLVFDASGMGVVDEVLRLKTAIETQLDAQGWSDAEGRHRASGFPDWVPGTKIELPPPTPASELAAAEELLGLELPGELREFWEFTKSFGQIRFSGGYGLGRCSSAAEWTQVELQELMGLLRFYEDAYDKPWLTPRGRQWITVSPMPSYLMLVAECDLDGEPGKLWVFDPIGAMTMDNAEWLWSEAAPNLTELLAAHADFIELGRVLIEPNQDATPGVRLHFPSADGLTPALDDPSYTDPAGRAILKQRGIVHFNLF